MPPKEFMKLAPQFRVQPKAEPAASSGLSGLSGLSDEGGEGDGEGAKLSDGEYRTVLAAQRTLLAFLRTALAVLVVFRDSAFGPILASSVALLGIVQFATAAPLYVMASQRVGGRGGRGNSGNSGNSGGRVDAHRLFRWTQVHSALVCALVVVIAAIAVPWRFQRELDDSATVAETAIEVFD